MHEAKIHIYSFFKWKPDKLEWYARDKCNLQHERQEEHVKMLNFLSNHSIQLWKMRFSLLYYKINKDSFEIMYKSSVTLDK